MSWKLILRGLFEIWSWSWEKPGNQLLLWSFLFPLLIITIRHSTFTPDGVKCGQPLLFLRHLRFPHNKIFCQINILPQYGQIYNQTKVKKSLISLGQGRVHFCSKNKYKYKHKYKHSLASVRAEDEGVYACVAGNILGETLSRFANHHAVVLVDNHLFYL